MLCVLLCFVRLPLPHPRLRRLISSLLGAAERDTRMRHGGWVSVAQFWNEAITKGKRRQKRWDTKKCQTGHGHGARKSKKCGKME